MKEKRELAKKFIYTKNYYQRGIATYIAQPMAIFAYILIIYRFSFKNIVYIPEALRHLYIFIPGLVSGLLIFGFYGGRLFYKMGWHLYEQEFKNKYSLNWKKLTAIEEKLDLLTQDKQTIINKSFSEGVRVGEKRGR